MLASSVKATALNIPTAGFCWLIDTLNTILQSASEKRELFVWRTSTEKPKHYVLSVGARHRWKKNGSDERSRNIILSCLPYCCPGRGGISKARVCVCVCVWSVTPYCLQLSSCCLCCFWCKNVLKSLKPSNVYVNLWICQGWSGSLHDVAWCQRERERERETEREREREREREQYSSPPFSVRSPASLTVRIRVQAPRLARMADSCTSSTGIKCEVYSSSKVAFFFLF